MDDFAEGWREAVRETAENLREAVDESCKVGAAVARTSHDYKDRTGDATRSIRGNWTRADEKGAQGEIKCSVPYGAVLANGSVPHVIEGDPLVFPGADGRMVFTRRVNHPGTKADPFMDNARDAAEIALEHEADIAVAKAFRDAGFE